MKLIRNVTAIVGAIFFVWMAASVQAQHAFRLSENEMKSLLERIEKDADRFRSSLKDALEDSRFDDTRQEDRINDFVKGFEAATDRLEDRFDDDRSASSDVEEVLRRAASIDNFMLRHRLNARAQSDWASLRASLDQLASAYNVSWNWMGVSNRPYRISEEQLKNLLERIEKGADSFRDSLDDALDDSRFDDRRAEDEINRFVKEFEVATDRLEDRFGKNQTSAGDAEEVLRRAASIDNFMRRFSLSSRAQSDWANLRRNLDELAVAYGVVWRW